MGSAVTNPVSRKEIWSDPVVHGNGNPEQIEQQISNPSKLGFLNPYQRNE
jgi:hypothetical protein